MKNVKKVLNSMVLIFLYALGIMSCKETPLDGRLDDPLTVAEGYGIDTVIAIGQHHFTDINVCNDENVYVLENGRLKRISGTSLIDVPFPASVYTDFNPTYFAISKDYTFVLRASNGIKRIKGNQVTFYKVGEGALINYTDQPLDDKQVFGEREVSYNEADSSILFGVEIGDIDVDDPYFQLAKITKNGVAQNIGMDPDPHLSFDVNPQGNIYTCTALGQHLSGRVTISSLVLPPFLYSGTGGYGVTVGNHGTPPQEGPIADVGFNPPRVFTLSRDGNTTAFISIAFNTETGASDTVGILKRVKDGVLTNIISDIKSYRLALSNDGKKLYLAGDGFFVIDDF